jgi:hypothetical protein
MYLARTDVHVDVGNVSAIVLTGTATSESCWPMTSAEGSVGGFDLTVARLELGNLSLSQNTDQ